MIIKTSSNKYLRCSVKNHKNAKIVMNIMDTCFKKHELRVNINLVDEPPNDGYDGWVTLFKTHNKLKPHAPFYEFDLFLVKNCTSLMICHELTHISRFCKYGYKDKRCHDEESVENEAVKRLGDFK